MVTRQRKAPLTGAPYDDEPWSLYAKLHHRLNDLDSPDPRGWLAVELAVEYDATTGNVYKLLNRLVADGYAFREGDYFSGSGK